MTYGKKMQEICEQLGVDINQLPNKLYSTLLEAIEENAGSGDITLENISITENGTYTAATGKAYKKATVNVPQPEPVQPTLVAKAITENGTYSAANDNADGYSSVTVNVEQGITPTGQIEITENGTYDVTDKASAVVNVSGGGDVWEMFDRFVAKGSSTTNEIEYIKKDYMGCIPQGLTSGNKQQLYEKLKFFSCRDFESNYFYLEASTFRLASAMKYCRLPHLTLIMNNSLLATVQIKSLVLVDGDKSNASLQGTNAFSQSGISMGAGYIYVKPTLVSTYKSATNWSTYADQIKGYDEADEYSATTTYAIGDVCKYNGKFYGYCKADLTPSTGNAPAGTENDNAYWEFVDNI